MKIFLAGGFGTIGSAIIPLLMKEGHTVNLLDRSPSKQRPLPAGGRRIPGDSTVPGEWQNETGEHDVIINLVGESIFQRWNKKIKKRIYDSRIETTRNIVDAIKKSSGGQKVLINASSTGYFGYEESGTEDDFGEPGSDFLATVSRDWEKEAKRAEDFGTRVVCLRFSPVLSTHGGALGILIPLYKFFLGSKLGSGKQWFPWIHEDDLAGIFNFALNNDISGSVNCASPVETTNEDFTRALAKSLHRPILVPFVPGFALRIVLGELGKTLLTAKRIIPKRLLDAGFEFRLPEIKNALGDVVEKINRG